MRRFLILAIALFAALPAAAQDTQTYRSAEGGFVLDLPAGWVRGPASDVAEMSSAAAAAPELTYEAVFQVPGAALAAIGRRVMRRRVTPEEFRGATTAGDAQANMQRAADGEEARDGIRMGLQVGVPWWDEANRATWIRADVEVSGGFAWTVLMLHPSGRSVIMLQYYADPGEDEEQVLVQLDEVVRSLRVD